MNPLNWSFWKKTGSQSQCNHDGIPIMTYARGDKYYYCQVCDTLRIDTEGGTLFYGPDSIMLKDEGIRLIINREVEKNSYTSNW
jgi:hypothetical protein